MGVAKFTHHTEVVFYANGMFWLLYRAVNRLCNCSRRNVNIVNHLLPVSVWLIVSRENILLPAEIIPLPEEANLSRSKSSSSFSVQGSVFHRIESIDALLPSFRVGGGVHGSYTCQCRLVGSYTSPGIEGTDGF